VETLGEFMILRHALYCITCLSRRFSTIGRTVAVLENNELCFYFPAGRNLPTNIVLRLACTCAKCVDACPVHVLWPYFASKAVGAQPFRHIVTPKLALKFLRNRLERLSVPSAQGYRLADLALGHSIDYTTSVDASVADSSSDDN